MGFFGNLLGQAIGGLGGGLFGHRDTGAKVGGTLGNLLPFKKGGKVVMTPMGAMMVPAAPKKAKRKAKAKARK